MPWPNITNQACVCSEHIFPCCHHASNDRDTRGAVCERWKSGMTLCLNRASGPEANRMIKVHISQSSLMGKLGRRATFAERAHTMEQPACLLPVQLLFPTLELVSAAAATNPPVIPDVGVAVAVRLTDCGVDRRVRAQAAGWRACSAWPRLASARFRWV